MVQKRLQNESQYNEYDLDGDGVVSDEELNTVKTISEAEAAEEKEDVWLGLVLLRCSSLLV